MSASNDAKALLGCFACKHLDMLQPGNQYYCPERGISMGSDIDGGLGCGCNLFEWDGDLERLEEAKAEQ